MTHAIQMPENKCFSLPFLKYMRVRAEQCILQTENVYRLRNALFTSHLTTTFAVRFKKR